MLDYPTLPIFHWWQFWRFVRYLVISLTVFPIVGTVIFTMGFATVLGKGHPFVMITESAIQTGQAFQNTAHEGVYTTVVCKAPPIPSESFGDKSAPSDLGLSENASTRQPILPPKAYGSQGCSDQNVSAVKLAEKLRQGLSVLYLVFVAIGLFGSTSLYLGDLLNNLDVRRRVRKFWGELYVEDNSEEVSV